MKRFFCFLCVVSIVILFLLAGCEKENKLEMVASIALEKEELSIRVDEIEILKVFHTPSNLPVPYYEWQSSNSSIATIDKGRVVGVSVGEVIVKVTALELGLSASCKVKVSPIDSKEIKLNIYNGELVVGDRLQLIASVLPTNASDKTVTWRSSNKSVATVDGYGNINAVAKGEVEITAEVNNGNISATCVLTVLDPLDVFYRDKTYGFMVKDTTNLDLITVVKSINDEASFLSGRRNKKLWIAKFDTHTKEQVSEFVDNEELAINQSVHIGYGVYKDISINKIDLTQYIENENGWIINVKLKDTENENYISLILFDNESGRKVYRYDNSTSQLLKWYDGSCYSVGNTGSSVMFNKSGEIIMEEKRFDIWSSAEMALSYTEFLHVGKIYYDDFNPSIFKSWVGVKNAGYAASRWSRTLPIFKNKDAKYEYEIISKNDNFWKFKFYILEYSGEKHSIEISVDIKTGDLQM